jgi:hypothetical protein
MLLIAQGYLQSKNAWRLFANWKDQLDEYLKIGESTVVECLKVFVKGVIDVFGEEYLRRPTA